MTNPKITTFYKASVQLLLLLLLAFNASGQEDPPRPMKVSTYQHLNFGAFINGSGGGTITIEPGGSRNITGDIIPVYHGYQYHPAIFEVEANAGVVISILNGPAITLTGNNGGSMLLQLGQSLPVSPFVNSTHPPFKTQIMVGGTLMVGNFLANPPGDYTGQFFITFIQE
ncbi:hypothetical protein SDC9_08875 [bioreactor metagenome]|jgi:hypothetical protein|uniref:DUF4402 domain-containing protein n=1 Tax=bioreactor metagenome TaxID=1076179 RepID=A0A644T8J2_9ZZZZ|nr:DUF4402 domain-containing protein [Lentimicrobium sp.]MEA5109474.1 DUF4402 domain-containing protein [Lentimicrobium sp.]HCT69799.1 hypothetical protein [Bacteroidales bacterium]